MSSVVDGDVWLSTHVQDEVFAHTVRLIRLMSQVFMLVWRNKWLRKGESGLSARPANGNVSRGSSATRACSGPESSTSADARSTGIRPRPIGISFVLGLGHPIELGG
jgi:hypothetical protein